jgi:hypothetical protein
MYLGRPRLTLGVQTILTLHLEHLFMYHPTSEPGSAGHHLGIRAESHICHLFWITTVSFAKGAVVQRLFRATQKALSKLTMMLA